MLPVFFIHSMPSLCLAGPAPQDGVMLSGVPVFSSIFFPANSLAMSTVQIDEFTIMDDEVALEHNEQYQIMFFNASFPSDVVTFGQPTTITIVDDDCKFNV